MCNILFSKVLLQQELEKISLTLNVLSHVIPIFLQIYNKFRMELKFEGDFAGAYPFTSIGLLEVQAKRKGSPSQADYQRVPSGLQKLPTCSF